MKDLAKAIQKEFSKCPDGWVVLLETPADVALDANLAAIKTLTDKGHTAIVVSASRNYDILKPLYEKAGINMKKVFVIDCVSKFHQMSKLGDKKLPEDNRVLYLYDAWDLKDFYLSVTEAIKLIPGNKFMCLDSLTTVLFYHRPEPFSRFIHNMLVKIRSNEGVVGLLLSLEKETEPEARAEIAQLCDKVLHVE